MIATNIPAFALQSGTTEVGLSDHKLVYTIFNRKVMKPKTSFTKARCFKNFDEVAFNKDLACVPFNVAFVFDDISDICWAWEKCMLMFYMTMQKCLWTIEVYHSRDTEDHAEKERVETQIPYKTRSAVDWEAYRSHRNRVVSMRRKSVKEHFDHLRSSRVGKPREFWKSLRPLMHTRKSTAEEFTTLKEKQSVITDQNQISQVLNEYFTNITKGFIPHKHYPFMDQSHVSRIPLIDGVTVVNAFGLT